MQCDTCAYYMYDEDDEEFFCTVDMDEDEYARLLESSSKACPFWRNGDEYEVVRHQM